MNINELVKKAYENAVSKGFYDDCGIQSGNCLVDAVSLERIRENDRKMNTIKSELMGIISEVAEVEKAFRDGQPIDIMVELADVIIRTCTFVGFLNIKDFERVIENKMEYNRSRPYKHKE